MGHQAFDGSQRHHQRYHSHSGYTPPITSTVPAKANVIASELHTYLRYWSTANRMGSDGALTPTVELLLIIQRATFQ